MEVEKASGGRIEREVMEEIFYECAFGGKQLRWFMGILIYMFVRLKGTHGRLAIHEAIGGGIEEGRRE